MNRVLKCVLAAFLLLAPLDFAIGAEAGRPNAEAVAHGVEKQSVTPWDELLDRFELICRKCLDLKQRKEAGEPISSSQLISLMDQLESLRGEIKNVSDKMPVAARKRFYAIRKMYATGVVACTRPETVPAIASAPLPQGALSRFSTPVLKGESIQPKPILWPSYKIVSLTVSAPEMAYGVSGEYWGRRLGVWASVRSSFSFHNIAYSALSDGSSGDGRIWTSGKAATDRFFATGGPVLRISRSLALFGGAGYGIRQLCWEDYEGDWMLIKDRSHRGVCCELGATLLLGRTALSASWLTLPLKYNSATIAVGFCF